MTLSKFYIMALALQLGFFTVNAAENKTERSKPILLVNKAKLMTIDEHAQIYGASCIPSAIEMVLKLTDQAPVDFYDLQKAWKNKADGNFRDFDGKTIREVTFHKQFGLPRNDEFPLENLFKTIDSELNAGRFVIISLPSSAGWHMYVIYEKEADGDYVALSKIDRKTITQRNIKKIVTKMKGTDILTYEIKKAKKV